MMNFDQAKKTIIEAVPLPGTEKVPVRKALGRVLAEDISVPGNFPDVRLSAIDGYAVKIGAGTEFRMVDVVAAGEQSDSVLEPGQCVAVMTGGIVPDGCDCMVRVEDCEKDGDIIKVKIDMEPGALINEPGSESAAGAPLLTGGTRISRSVYPSLFYAGIPEVRVYVRPSVGILVSGDELREVEDGYEKGLVFNTNRYILESFLDALGLNCRHEMRVPDDEAATRRALDEMAGKCTFVVSSGGVSMGRYDYIKKVFLETDFSLLIQETAIKPGRPLMVAQRKANLFFGMPGYPSAFLTNALLYLIPALKKACGRTDYETRWLKARLATPIRSRKGRLYLNRAVLTLEDGEWIARDPGSQKTSHFLNFSHVNGLVSLPGDVDSPDAGDYVRALHFDLELC